MSSEWSKVKLADYCDKIGSGATPRGGSKVYLDSGQIALVRSQNVYNHGFDYDGLVYIDEEAAEKLSNVELLENDVLINITGDSVARVCMVPDDVLPARVNQHVSILRPKNDSLDPRFLRYSLVNFENQYKLLAIASSGGTRKALTKGHLEEFEISLPDIAYQKEVSEILLTFDQKIQLNQQTNETLETMAQAIFKSWFVDFDPVRAKIDAAKAGRDPNRAAMAAIAGVSLQKVWDEIEVALDQKLGHMTDEQRQQLSRTAELFPDELVESEIGEVPKGWGVVSLSEFINIKGGTQPPSKVFIDELKDGYIRLVQIRDYETDGHKTFIPETEKLRITEPMDIMIGRYGAAVGRILWGMDGAYNVALVKAQIKKELTREYIRTYLLSDIFQNRMQVISGRSAQSGFNKGDIASFRLVKPPSFLLRTYEEKIKPIRENGLSLNKQNETLAHLRDTLLPKLISGEIELT